MLTHVATLFFSGPFRALPSEIMSVIEHPRPPELLKTAWTICVGQTWSHWAILSRCEVKLPPGTTGLERRPSCNHNSQLLAVLPTITSLSSTTTIFRCPFRRTTAEAVLLLIIQSRDTQQILDHVIWSLVGLAQIPPPSNPRQGP